MMFFCDKINNNTTCCAILQSKTLYGVNYGYNRY
jgi:hypothetical protein